MFDWNVVKDVGCPTEDGEYIVSDGARVYLSKFFTDKGFGIEVSVSGKKYFSQNTNINAWIKLPEPYKE